MEARAFLGTKFDLTTLPHTHSRRNLFSAVSWSVQISPTSHHLRLRDTNLPKSHAKSFKLKAKSSDLESTRPLAKFPPSIWGDRFLSVPSTDKLELDAMEKEIDELKPKIREMLMSSHINDKEKIQLIHLIMSLGLSYHFENEIDDILNHAFGNLGEIIADEFDLYTISTMFQVFRLHGHNMPCDVFDRFKDDDGNFMKCLESDARAMLSLYEATHLRTTTEYIMDEAMSFTKNYLDSMATDQASPHLHSLIKNALHRPRLRSMEILVAREYITFYEQEEDHDEILLKFAKLNFKYLQLHYIQELEIVSKWWKEQDLPSKLPYFRDRLVECYFTTVGAYVEPQYSFQRITMTKLFIIATITDDSCDAYGTLPEVSGLVESIERWDLSVINKLPNYMKVVFGCSMQLLMEIEREVKHQGTSYVMQEAVEEAKVSMRAMQHIAKWAREGHVPNFEEYMEFALHTTGISLLTKVIILWMEENDGEQVFEWLRSTPKVTRTLNAISRLANDKASYKHETDRGEVVNGISCYMKQFGVTEEEAVRAIQRMYEHNYKILIEEFLKTNNMPRKFLSRFLKSMSVFDVLYKDGDGYTYPRGNIDHHIVALFIDRIEL